MTSANLPNISFNIKLPYVPDGDLRFENSESLKKWAQHERDAIREIGPDKFAPNDLWAEHHNNAQRLISAAERLASYLLDVSDGSAGDSRAPSINERQVEIKKCLDPYRRGTLITSFHPNFQIASLCSKSKDYDAARSILQASRRNGPVGVSEPQPTTDTDTLIRALLSLPTPELREPPPIH